MKKKEQKKYKKPALQIHGDWKKITKGGGGTGGELGNKFPSD